MNGPERGFRTWWQVPRRAGEPHRDRRVSFLELFYDLVYVVLISQLAHSFSQDISLVGAGKFAFLFVTIWWAWLNGTLYHDLHGNNDIRTRVFTFVQMITVAAMAVFIHNAIGEGSTGFAISYAAFQLIMTYMWWRTGVHDPDHRPLSTTSVIVGLLSIILYIGSIFIPGNLKYYMWAFALFLFLVSPGIMIATNSNNPRGLKQLEIISSYSPAAVERFGLFTIIVLGEVVVSVVNGVVNLHHINWPIGITAVLGMLMAIGFYWLYFDFISHRIPVSGIRSNFLWVYFHLPMTMGIAAAGAGVLNAVEHTDKALPGEVRWVLVGTAAIVLLSIAILMRMIRVPQGTGKYYRRGSLVITIMGIGAALLGLTSLETIPLLAVIIIIILVPAIYGIIVWVKVFGGVELGEE
jgi:low temperature requirement protein LtrA